MTDHISQPQPGTPALDYEAVKDYFFHKLEADRHGRGRMESALFHTATFIFDQGCHERDKLLARIAELEDEVANLACDAHCAALGEREFMLAVIEDELKRWKPVCDGLPDDGIDVIVTDGEAVWSAFHEEDSWKFFDGSTVHTPITHWMDFPRGPHDDA